MYPCNRIITELPCWTFNTNTSSGVSISSQRNRMINRSCIPGGTMPLFSTTGCTITRNLERYGLPSIWNLAGILLTFCSIIIFCHIIKSVTKWSSSFLFLTLALVSIEKRRLRKKIIWRKVHMHANISFGYI